MLYTLLWNLLLTAGLAVLLALLSRLPWMQRRPALTHWLWLLLLVKLVTPPLIPVPLLPAAANESPTVRETTLSSTQPQSEEPAAHDLTAESTFSVEPMESDEFIGLSEPPPWGFPEVAQVPASSDEPWSSPVPAVLPSERLGSTPSPLVIRTFPFPYVSGLVALSLFGTCTLLTLHGLRAVKFNRWLKRAGTGDSTLTDCCAKLASDMNFRGRLQSVVVDTRTTPLLWGWRRPVVAVPRQLVDELEPGQLRSILAHELAHLVRRDHWANLFVCLVKALMWWNPVVWWADRELRVAQEMCCDAIAIERCRANRSTYAATLLKTLDFIHPPVASSRLALGMGSRGTILRRFEMIGERGLTYRTSRWAIFGLLVVGTALACMPVRGQEEKTPASSAPTFSEADAAPAPVETPSDDAEKGNTPKAPNVEAEEADSGKTIVEMLSDALGATTDLAQAVSVLGKRPHGNCSISGKVVCAETGEPLKGATLYLFYGGNHTALFVRVGDDGTFVLKDIPTGPHSLRTQNTPGYQQAVYNPEGKSPLYPQFSLAEGEHRTNVLLRAKPAYSISGKIRDATGAVPDDVADLTVSALGGKGNRYQWAQGSSANRKDGSYAIDGLDGQPVYLMVTNRAAEKEGSNRPPVFYPGTFSRNKSRQIVFDKNRSMENVDITLRTKGGFVLEGKVVNEDGDPVPEAFLLVHRRDMFGDNLTTYTNKQGRYRIQGLGEGEFLVHVDASHRGYVRVRSPLDVDGTDKRIKRDFTLARGVLIAGKLVDEEGKDWQIGSTFGYAHVFDSQDGGWTHARGGLFNKFAPKGAAKYHGSPFKTGEGPYGSRQMIFPTKSSFAIHGMTPGRTRLNFLPNKEGQEVVEIRHQGKNILDSDFETTPGQTIDDVVIVIGSKEAKVARTGIKPQQERTYGNRPRGTCSISGKVISAETGEPVDHARVYLFYTVTNSGLFVNVASDGTFMMKDIPTGPFFLKAINTAGYQDLVYDPEGTSGPLPRFSLKEGEHRTNVVFEIKPACQISGKVIDENGKVPDCVDDLTVLAWVEDPDGKFRSEQARVHRNDGSYSIDGLDDKPAYVMAINWKSNRTDNAYPPVYHPSTFNRDDARRISFDDGCIVENVNITLVKEGGLALTGAVTDDSGKPVPEAFVVVHRRDMLFDFVTDYTDEDGRYRIHGLGKGDFLVHVDAAHRGFVRSCKPLELDGSVAENQRDFTLPMGVTISGKLVDDQGKEWRMARSHGYAAIPPDEDSQSAGTFSLSRFRNKFGPQDVNESSPGSFRTAEGDYSNRHMFFPTASTFLIQGMVPGQTQIGFSPNKEGQDVLEILYEGQDIKDSGVETKAGDKVEDVTIVIGARRPAKTTEVVPDVLTLKDGETRRLKVGKNVTPVAEISVTPHFADDATEFELEAIDAEGKPIEGTRVTLRAAHDLRVAGINLGRSFRVNGKDISVAASLTVTRRDDDLVDVQVKVSFNHVLTSGEKKDRPQIPGKLGEQLKNMRQIARLITEHKQKTDMYPENLEVLDQPLPKDVYSPSGEAYHYVRQHRRYILSGCGKDGIHGNDDDNVVVGSQSRTSSGLRSSVSLEPDEDVLGQKENIYGVRPQGDCSLGGRVVSAATGQPISHATVHLYHTGVHASFMVEVEEALLNRPTARLFSMALTENPCMSWSPTSKRKRKGDMPRPSTTRATSHVARRPRSSLMRTVPSRTSTSYCERKVG